MIPNITLRQCDLNREGRKQLYNPDIFQERFRTIERLFAWEDKFKRLLLRFEHKSKNFYGFKILAYTMINLAFLAFIKLETRNHLISESNLRDGGRKKNYLNFIYLNLEFLIA